MNSTDTIELRIQDVAYRGRGMARLDGMVYFVDGVLPDELVRARVTKQKKSWAEAALVEILQASPLRIAPACEFAEQCQGCCYQHMSHSTEIAFKQKQLLSLLERIGGCPDATCRAPIQCPSALGYRNKISMHIQGSGNQRAIGYFMQDNKTVLDIPNCPLAMPPLNQLLTALRQDPALADSTSVTLRYTEHDGAVFWTDRIAPSTSGLIETTSLGDVRVPTRSFFQTNPQVIDALFDEVSQILSRNKPQTVIDLYCGVGTLAFAAARAGANTVRGIDSDNRSIHTAIRNGQSLDLAKVKFQHGSVEKLLKDSLSNIDLKTSAIILDPPRAGLSKPVVDILATNKPRDIIYVSCAADTMARDVKILTSHDYQLIDTGLVDMFPRTTYFESITHLSLSS